jgi:hypothetical protein
VCIELPQPGTAGLGDTGAAEQSSRPFPVGGFLCRGGGGGRRGRHALDLGAYTRVGGGLRAPVVPCPRCRGRLRRGRDADPAVGATTAEERFFPTYIYACRSTTPAGGGHRQGDGGGTERAVGHPHP